MAVKKKMREAAGAKGGEMIQVEMERDTEPRTIELPADFLAALNENLDAKEVWERLSYTHRKEFVQAIQEAKRAETRQRRIQKSIAEIAAKYSDRIKLKKS